MFSARKIKSWCSRPARFWVGILGAILVTAGFAGIMYVEFTGPRHNTETTVAVDRRFGYLELGTAALMVGVVLISQAVLSRQRITLDEARQWGKDIGFELGFKEGRKHPIGPVVVDLVRKGSVEEEVVFPLQGDVIPEEIRLRVSPPDRHGWRHKFDRQHPHNGTED